MDLIVTGIVAGVVGTLVMDASNHLLARTGKFSKIDIGTLGRMSSGWLRGRFRYHHPNDMERVANEVFRGYVAHYAIGLGLAFIYVFGWGLLIGGPASPLWALLYGIATTVASLFLVYPSMGFGACGRRSPDGIWSLLSSFANHLFFGAGMAAAIEII